MPAQSQDPAHLFAAYLEIVDESGPNRRRKQWIMLPQMPARLAPGDSPITSHLTWFEREQRSPSHRSVWAMHVDVSGMFRRNLADTVEMKLADGWKMTLPQIITCEVHPTELAQILQDRKTPYRIKERLEKVARSMYRIDVS
jgi:hypothetical protein